MNNYDEDIEFAFEMIKEFGSNITVDNQNAVAVKIPTSSGVSTSPSDTFGVLEDTSMTTNTVRILISGNPLPTVVKNSIIIAEGQQYTVDSLSILAPDFNASIYIDCVCYES